MRALQFVFVSRAKSLLLLSPARARPVRELLSECSSARSLETSRYSTAGTSIWRSMRSSRGPEIRWRYRCTCTGTAAAFALQIAEISAGQGFIAATSMNSRWEGQTAGRARDRDSSVFERLAHDFERGAFEFRQLIEKQHAVVREADFARGGERAAAEQADVADGVMRRTKRPRRDKRFLAVEQVQRCCGSWWSRSLPRATSAG